MSDMSIPIKNTAFILSFTLYKNDGTIVPNPGTYTKKVSIDGGAVADIAASVTEEDTTYGQLSLVLAAGEMNGDWIWVYITDDTAGTVPFTCSLYPAAGAPASAAALATVDGIVDSILTDTGTTLDGALASVASTLTDVHNTDLPAVKAVVDEIPTNAELATALGTADDATLAAIVALDAVVDTVKVDTAAVLIDTNELQLNQGNWATATGFSTFDPAADVVAHVTLVDTTTNLTYGIAGSGPIEWLYNLKLANNDPIADVDVWVTTDADGTNVVASGRTDEYGNVTFYLDAGTVYVWAVKSGFNFVTPDVEVVS